MILRPFLSQSQCISSPRLSAVDPFILPQQTSKLWKGTSKPHVFPGKPVQGTKHRTAKCVENVTWVGKGKVHPCTGTDLCTGRTAHRGSRGIALPFHDHGTRRGWGVSVTPRPLFTPGKTRYPLYRRLGGPQGRSGQVRKISPPPGFDPRTVQPVASRYTDWATRPTECHVDWRKLTCTVREIRDKNQVKSLPINANSSKTETEIKTRSKQK